MSGQHVGGATLDYEVRDFRNAAALLDPSPAWRSVRSAIESISREEVIREQETLVAVRRRAPRGGQTAFNSLFSRMLTPEDGWVPQPRLFRDRRLREWKMDFLRDEVGIEVSFNHAEAIAWQFTRLNIAGESERVVEESRIKVGIVITATQSLKKWSRMDSAVGTFDAFSAWLTEMKPILPIPLLVIGLGAAGWEPSGVFGGTRALTRT